MDKKYFFKPYSPSFPELFRKEKDRIASLIRSALAIEHVGSTAVPGLGGKGIIDIAIAIQPQETEVVSAQLQKLGYVFRESGSTPTRLFFRVDLPDPEQGIRRYHVHLTSLEGKDWKDLISFRDYLRNHPDTVQEYAELKEKAAFEVNEDGEKYRKLKDPIFKKILSKENN